MAIRRNTTVNSKIDCNISWSKIIIIFFFYNFEKYISKVMIINTLRKHAIYSNLIHRSKVWEIWVKGAILNCKHIFTQIFKWKHISLHDDTAVLYNVVSNWDFFTHKLRLLSKCSCNNAIWKFVLHFIFS